MSVKSSNIFLNDLVTRHPALECVADAIEQAAEAICKAHRSGGKVLVCGNGGSAADGGHIAGELMKNFVLKRTVPAQHADALKTLPDGDALARNLQPGVAVISLCDQAPLLTAVINDTDPAMIYAQQAYVYGRPGDVIIGLSTSGNAANVISALRVSKTFGMVTIGMTGAAPGRMDDECDIIIKAPATETFLIQEYHLPIYHTLCLMIEHELFAV